MEKVGKGKHESKMVYDILKELIKTLFKKCQVALGR